MYSREGAMRWERYSNHLDTLPQDDTPVLKNGYVKSEVGIGVGV